MKLYNHYIPNYTYNAAAQSAQKTYTNLLTIGKKYRVSFDFGIDGITSASYTLSNGSVQLRNKENIITTREVTEFTATATNLTLLVALSTGNYSRLAHIDNLVIEEIFEVGEGYRFGFNGMEKDNEVAGEGNSYTTQNRQLDTRLGRWFSVDPILHHNWSPYNAFDANPIIYTDILGTTVGYGGTAEQAKATETKVKDLTDEKSANYNKVFTEKFNKLATDQNNHFIFEEWTTTKTDENNRLVGGQFAPSTLGKTASGQNQMSISFTTNLPSHFQDHSLGPLFEEVDHAVQFQEGRLSYVTRIDEKILSPAYDAFDEADNKLAKGEMIKSFASGSTYAKEPLFGLTQKIVTGKITRDQLVKKMASQYKLPIENIDAFQGVSRAYKREDGFTPYSPDYIKSMHNQGSTPNTVFIGLPKTQ